MPFRLIVNVLVLGRWIVEWVLLWPFVLLRARQRHFVSIDLGGAGLRGTFHLGIRRRWIARRGGAQTYEALDELLQRVERSRGVEGILVRIDEPRISPSDAGLIRQRLARTRAAGKRVACYFDSAGATELIIASQADSIMMAPAGRVTLLGLKAELTFIRSLLSRLGVRAQFMHIGRHKTAMNMFTRDESSEPQRATTVELIKEVSSTIAALTRREGDAGGAGAVAESSWPFERPIYTSAQARRAGLIDHQAFPDQVSIRLRAEKADGGFDPLGTYGDETRIKEYQARLKGLPRVWLQSDADFRRLRPHALKLRPLRSRPVVAVVEMSGLIMPQVGRAGPLQQPAITPEGAREVFKRLRENARVRAVVLAIDSRGGSALASDLIWREIRRLRHRKPVVAALRSVAASGGYYIAVAADEIVASELTITGSIGIIYGKFSLEEALAKASVSWETVAATGFSTLQSTRHPFTGGQLELIQEDLRTAYRRFVNRVVAGRPLNTKQVHRVGRGRVFLGGSAHRLGLVDGVGSVADAIDRAMARAEISPRRARVRYYSLHRRGLLSLLSADAVEAQSFWLDPRLRHTAQLVGLVRRDPVLAYCDELPVSEAK